MPTIKAILYKSKTLKDNTHPVYFRLSGNKKTFYLPIYKNDNRFRAYLSQWDSVNNGFVKNKKINPGHKELNEIIETRYLRLSMIINQNSSTLNKITIEKIKQEFYNEKPTNDIIAYIENLIAKNISTGTNSNLSVLKQNLIDYTRQKSISFTDIDYDFVHFLIQWYTKNNCNNTTIGIRLRYLRLALNKAITEKIGSKETYPFSNKYGASQWIKISQFEKEERKLAIDKELIDKIKNQSFPKFKYELARRLFLASYAARGMNFKDMALITKDNIVIVEGKEHLAYRRRKTNTPITMAISPLLKEQMQWFEDHCNLFNKHLFPIFNSTIKDVEHHMIKELNKFNYYLRQITKQLGINQDCIQLSSYVARHSFASNLFHNGISVNVISTALGHTSTSTTSAYLKQFSEDQIGNDIINITG